MEVASADIAAACFRKLRRENCIVIELSPPPAAGGLSASHDGIRIGTPFARTFVVEIIGFVEALN
jgi:hypothetical protein